jgi:hypothetical protein
MLRRLGVSLDIAKRTGEVGDTTGLDLQDADQLSAMAATYTDPAKKSGPLPSGSYIGDDNELLYHPGYGPPVTKTPTIQDGGTIEEDEDGNWTWTGIAGFPEDAEGEGKHVSSVAEHLIVFSDGTTYVMNPAEALAANAKTERKHEIWVQENSARQSDRLELSKSKFWQLQTTAILSAVDDARDKVFSGEWSQAKAEVEIRAAAALRSDDPDSYVRAARPFLRSQELKIIWSPTQQDDLIEMNVGIAHAERAMELLNHPVVMDEIGDLTNALEGIDEYLSGGMMHSKETMNFLNYLRHVKDASVSRVRSGAVLSKDETKFYDMLLGSEFTDPVALRGRLLVFKEYQQTGIDAMNRFALEQKYSDNESGLNRAWALYQERNYHDEQRANDESSVGEAPSGSFDSSDVLNWEEN